MAENIIQENYKKVSHTLLTSDKQSIIDSFMTKQMVRIMLLLLDCTMTNKEIAQRMNLTSSALSSILKRMKNCEVDLLAVQKQDKNVLYSLTPIAQEYAEQNLIVKGKKDVKLIQINEKKTLEWVKCHDALKKLKERLGEDWDVEFPRCCFMYYENGKKGEVPQADAFFEAMEDIIIAKQEEQLENILDELGNESCRKLCLKYMNKYSSIRKLCSLYDEDWKLAHRFIDDVFSGEGMCVSYTFLAESGDLGKEDIVKMIEGLAEVMTQSKEMKLSKWDFSDIWGRYFYPHEKLLDKIADKYEAKYRSR